MNENLMPTAKPDFLSEKDIATLKADILKEFTPSEQETFVRICQRMELDPFTKQIFPISRRKKVRNEANPNKPIYITIMNTVTSITGLCATAIKTGHYDGCEIRWCGPDGIWKEEWMEETYPAAAKCTVYHKQRSHPEVAIAHFRAFAQTYKDDNRTYYTEFWNKMPEHMIAKCAKALALRGAFPDQLSDVLAEEEVGSTAETIGAEESKVVSIQQHDQAAVAAGAKILGSDQPLPTPEEALEPAFPEEPPAPPPAKRTPQPQPEPAFSQQLAQEYAQQQAATAVEEPDGIDMGPEPEPDWSAHVIKGVKSFKGRVLGSLDANEWALIEQKWIPAAHAQIKNATSEQLDDLKMFELKIAHDKSAKPW